MSGEKRGAPTLLAGRRLLGALPERSGLVVTRPRLAIFEALPARARTPSPKTKSPLGAQWRLAALSLATVYQNPRGRARSARSSTSMPASTPLLGCPGPAPGRGTPQKHPNQPPGVHPLPQGVFSPARRRASTTSMFRRPTGSRCDALKVQVGALPRMCRAREAQGLSSNRTRHLVRVIDRSAPGPPEMRSPAVNRGAFHLQLVAFGVHRAAGDPRRLQSG